MLKNDVIQFLDELLSIDLPSDIEHFVDVNFIPKILPQSSFKGLNSNRPLVKLSYDANAKIWILLADYQVDFKGFSITAPANFKFDLASVPRAFWWAIAPNELSIVAPLIHDLLYKYSGKLPKNLVTPYREFTRKQADEIFLNLMEQEGVSVWRRVIAYHAVRTFGEAAW
jgi:hypothetical protein